jgi:hypothetical protein
MTSTRDAIWNSSSYWSEPAELAFAKARRKARREVLVDRLRGRRSTLVPFDADLNGESMHRPGLLVESLERRLTVPLAQIVGSVDKWGFFTRSFLPKSDTLLARWKTIFAVAHGFGGYQPIELYERGGRFYVVDGHFRVSVARALGCEMIQARVRRWV